MARDLLAQRTIPATFDTPLRTFSNLGNAILCKDLCFIDGAHHDAVHDEKISGHALGSVAEGQKLNNCPHFSAPKLPHISLLAGLCLLCCNQLQQTSGSRPMKTAFVCSLSTLLLPGNACWSSEVHSNAPV
eukprot:762393-Amphidinium_carterae.1